MESVEFFKKSIAFFLRSLRRGLNSFASVFAFREALRLYFIICRFEKNEGKCLVISLTEHIGDLIACEPVARHLKDVDKKVPVIWVVNRRYKEVVQYNPFIDLIIEIGCLSEWIYLKNLLKGRARIIDLHTNGRRCSRFGLKLSNAVKSPINIRNYFTYGSILESFSMMAGLEKISLAPKLYLPPRVKTQLKTPNGYIAIQTSSNDIAKDWDIQKWRELVSSFPSQTFVEIGLEAKLNSEPNCITNFCGNISLLEAFELVRSAKLFLGIDSCFAHAANAFEVPGVVLLGQLAGFKRYQPYTGNYKVGKDCDIIHFDGPVKAIPVDSIIDRCKKYL